jgi:lipopolysaccharide cholinephosphotransferase
MCGQLVKLGYEEGIHIIKTADFYDINHVLSDGTWSQGLKEMSRKEIRSIQLKILKHVKEICKKYNLRYYLGAGSCLGAVRHKGYIPWDDDIDINLPYPDYLKLLEILSGDKYYRPISLYHYKDEFPYFFARIEDTETIMKNWEYPFLITSGVTIDMFPIFGLPDRQEDIMLFYDKIRKLNTLLIESHITCDIPNDEELKYRRRLTQQILDMMGEYDYDVSENIGYILSKNKEKDIMRRRIYSQAVEMEFEGQKFSVMSGYDEYLTALYGNYMQMPSDKEQRTTHSFRAFFKS